MSITKSNNQSAMKVMRDKGKSIMNERNPSQIYLTSEVEPNEPQKKLRLNWKTNVYQFNQNFQNVWTTKLPWAKSVLNEDEFVTFVWCKICKKEWVKKNFLFPNLIFLVNMLIWKDLQISHAWHIPKGWKHTQPTKNKITSINFL